MPSDPRSQAHGEVDCACQLFRFRHKAACICFGECSLQRMAASHDLAMILLHTFRYVTVCDDLAMILLRAARRSAHHPCTGYA